MPFEINIPLKKFNTFGFEVSADQAFYVTSREDLINGAQTAQEHHWPWRVLGSGSNVVLTENLPGLTLLMQIMGKNLVAETPEQWIIEVGAGENWHEFVEWTIEQGFAGLENLALIPGTCGAAPIQNIGAYGLEAGDLIESVTALDTSRLKENDPWVEIKKDHCQFAYRDSLFKKDPNRFIVTKVRFALPKAWQPNLSYAELAKRFSTGNQVSARDIFNAVCEIRSSKLPNPSELGNAGSFFHNPIVDDATHTQLKNKFPDLVSYPADLIDAKSIDQPRFKLAAGWLIDQCGLKGYRKGHVGVYEKQALVLVHHGEGTGKELLALADEIRGKVKEKFGVTLHQEPVIFPEPK
jgi:UDP-N-acetylmuramate dehydrogenase